MKLPSKEDLREKLGPLLRRWRIPLLFLALGAAILVLTAPSGNHTETPAVQTTDDAQYLAQMEDSLRTILSRIEGVGKVELMLSLESGREQLYQTDRRSTDGDISRTQEVTTVFETASGAQKSAVVARTRYPVFLGAVVVCQGGGNAGVRLAVVQAVSSLTGLGSDKITVIKMKE